MRDSVNIPVRPFAEKKKKTKNKQMKFCQLSVVDPRLKELTTFTNQVNHTQRTNALRMLTKC